MSAARYTVPELLRMLADAVEHGSAAAPDQVPANDPPPESITSAARAAIERYEVASVFVEDFEYFDLMERNTWVYFIQAGNDGLVKIGTTIHLAERASCLQGASPVPLRLRAILRGGEALERALHKRFARHRANGEWFHPGPSLLAFVELVRRRAGMAQP